MKIYTRGGDAGETSLFGGQRVPKSHLRVEAYGGVDELNSCLGLARAHAPESPLDSVLHRLQVELFVVGADLATPPEKAAKIQRVTPEMATALEGEIDTHDAELPALTNFVLPGGAPAAAALHLARTVCRRAERDCRRLADDPGHPGGFGPLLAYLNRLSDLLFVLARRAAQLDPEGRGEVLWEP